ncbi:MAG: ornithine cyclodeaminase family protein [Desulfitobacteriaceae bacterium]
MKITCLAEKDILQAVSTSEVMNAVEDAMILNEKKNEVYMPARLHLDYGNNTLLLMPCFTQEGFGTKLVTLFPENSRYNAPVTNGVMVLNKAETGEPLAFINGLVLTAMRTAAVGSVSIRHLASEGAETLGVIGAGGQGFYQVVFAAQARRIKDIYIYSRSPEKVDALLAKLVQAIPEIHLHKAKSVEELLEAADIVITATTAKEPVLPNHWGLLKGKHFVGIGSFKPDMREYPEALFRNLKRVFVDTEHALEETGDLIRPLKERWLEQSQIQTLGRLIMEDQSRIPKGTGGETTFFKSVGMALFDLIVGQLVFQKAQQKGLGQEINL